MVDAPFITVSYDDDSDEFTIDDEDDAEHDEELEDSFEDGVSFCTFLAYFVEIFPYLFDHFLHFSGKSR